MRMERGFLRSETGKSEMVGDDSPARTMKERSMEGKSLPAFSYLQLPFISFSRNQQRSHIALEIKIIKFSGDYKKRLSHTAAKSDRGG